MRSTITFKWYQTLLIEGLVSNFSNHITSSFFERRNRSCEIFHVNVGGVSTPVHNSLDVVQSVSSIVYNAFIFNALMINSHIQNSTQKTS